MKLTEQELKFIRLATVHASGVFDYDNNSEEEFKEAYGLSMEDADKMLARLQGKCDEEIQKIHYKIIAKDITKRIRRHENKKPRE